jgi:hypothetical protein
LATITTFGPLFDLAAADWAFTPLPPFRGGGRSPQVASRTISVSAFIVDLDNEGNEFVGTLIYTPGRLIKTGKANFEVPPTFSGNCPVQGDNEGEASGAVFMTIAADFLGGYYITMDIQESLVPESISFNPNPPNGAANPNVTDPLLNISFTGAGTVNGRAVSPIVQLSQYNFFLTFKGGSAFPYSPSRS